ncbi:hypothetical protein ABW19_dt0208736 [Dactylella cylindrospora]|nr:hypothetical protein ABW19_dt0208736 [Dactylella cylindrospora]
MSEFIGSRISLISRSDIRYVGTLHQIDSENSTVGLENVTNHGTEGRCEDPTNEVEGTDEIYDYIVFRGSDVKDLRMEAPEPTPKPPQPQSFPNDPAIINAQRPAGYPPQQFPYQQNGRPGQPPFNPNFPQNFYPHPPQMGPGGRFYGQPPYIGGFPGGPGAPGFPPGPFPYGMPPPFPGPGGPQQPPPGNNRAGAQTGPQAGPSAQPTPAKVELPGAESKDISEPKSVVPTPQAPGGPSELKPETSAPLTQPAVTQTQPTGPRNVGGRGRGGARGRGNFGSSQPGHTQTSATITTTTTTINPAAFAPAAAATTTESPGLADLERKVQAMRVNSANGFPQASRGIGNGPLRGRGRGRGGMSSHQPRKVEVPTTDYDFESANARFTKVAEGEEGAAPEAAESSAEARKPSIDQDAKPAIIAQDGYYNKGKSFFDNISCENKERAEAKESGIDGRQNAQRRNEEVKKNIETFGQGSVDSPFNRRGGWRGGRGGRGRGSGFRGRGRGGGGGHSQPVKANS